MAVTTWALKRQIFYIIILLAIIAVFGFGIAYPSLSRAPSCFDNKQNGTETGIDCGGSCATACLEQVDPLSVVWARAFRVIPGRYNAVAYITNHNKSAAVKKISYKFRFADANNVYIGKREGTTVVPPGGNFAIFEPAIDVGNSIPVYTTFEFTQTPTWLQVSPDKLSQLKVLVSDIDLQGGTDTAGDTPRLSAKIKNNSLFTIPDVGVVAILYDAGGNAISASRTYVSELGPLSGADLNFTWPENFSAPVVAKEIIPVYDVFSAQIK